MTDQNRAPDACAATIIPRAEHTLSRKNVSAAALKVLYRLNESGFEAYLVGGAVRDLLLGMRPKDFDVATNATPEQVKRLFRNCRLIGRRFRLAHVVFGREIIEVATFRGNGDPGEDGARQSVNGRLVRDNVWGTIEEDAWRRDFRVNALYYDISDFSVRDYVHGMHDLDARLLRLIGDPETRYREDPVRMLRAARLAAKLDFQVGPDAAAPLPVLGHLLGVVSSARLFDESLKLFLSGHGVASLRQLEHHDLLQHLFPITAEVLGADPDDHYRRLLERGLASTDQRVAEGKSVTPAFLFALLLWGGVRRHAEQAIARGEHVAMAWQEASARVIREQTQRVAIPRRFVFAMEEIWALQLRFDDHRRKRVLRLLEHPRFRAAYDFLLMRCDESAQVEAAGQWWTAAQETPHHAADADSPAATEPRAGTRGRRRRRRRKAGDSATGEGH